MNLRIIHTYDYFNIYYTIIAFYKAFIPTIEATEAILHHIIIFILYILVY